MKPYNQKIADAFNEIADLMGILDVEWYKTRAYREGARQIMQYINPITKKDVDPKKLKEIPRIGDALSAKMIQFLKTGKIELLEEMRKKIPKPVRILLKIPGLGPKRVKDLYINLGIKSKKDIKKYAKNGQIVELSGFGDKLVEQILNAIDSGQQKKKRHKRKDIEPIAKKLTGILKKIKGIKKVTIAGSYRRKLQTVGDLDILVVTKNGKSVNNLLTICKQFANNMNILEKGDTKVSFIIFPDNLQIDIRFVQQESYGAALLYFTGSKESNIMMRKVAIKKGYLLNEYGLFEDGEYIVGKMEKEVFEKLGLPVVKPEKRR